MKTYWVSRVISPRILNLDTRLEVSDVKNLHEAFYYVLSNESRLLQRKVVTVLHL